MRLRNYTDIPADWKIFTVKKKSLVRIRPSMKVERFKVSWATSELESDPDSDFILIQEDGTEYPIKTDIFFDTYESADENGQPWSKFRSDLPKHYRKKATSKIAAIPPLIQVTVETLEGDVFPVSYPDYVAIGARGELYPNKDEWVEKNLEIL